MSIAESNPKRAGPSRGVVTATALLWLVVPVFIGFAAVPAMCGLAFMIHFPVRVAVSVVLLGVLALSLTPWMLRGWKRALPIGVVGAVWLAVSVPYSVSTWHRAKCGAEAIIWASGLRGDFDLRQRGAPSSEDWKDWLPRACACATEADFDSPLGAPGWERDGVFVLSTDPRAFTGELKDVVVGYVLTPERGPCREMLHVVFGDGTVNWIYERDGAEIVRGAMTKAEGVGFPSPPGEFVRALERIEGR